MRLGRDWIEAHLPHRGAMCLLDGVLEYDGRRIVCRASSHSDPANPLRVGDRLPAACGVEYGAQAMAAHGAPKKVASGRTASSQVSATATRAKRGASSARSARWASRALIASATAPSSPNGTTQPRPSRSTSSPSASPRVQTIGSPAQKQSSKRLRNA